MSASVLPLFYFLRHGETEWNRLGLCQGQNDIALNETGISQAEAARDLLAETAITRIVSSDLCRARTTAEIVNQLHGVPLRTTSGLREISFGTLEGQPRPYPRYSELLENAAQHGGESFERFADRIMDALNVALADGGLPLIVSHGGVFHALKSRFGLDETSDLSNAAPVLFLPAERRFDVIVGRAARIAIRKPHP
jgi:2,3-bisphosphoglycerate-dependent phosphoglycerate mutase